MYNSSAGDDVFVSIPDPTSGGGVLTWVTATNLPSGQFLQLKFQALAVAPSEGQALVQVNDGFLAQGVGSENLTVLDANESDDPSEAPKIEPDRLYFGRLSSAEDVDYFDIDIYGESIRPGSTLTMYLSQLRYDADLTAFHPQSSPGLQTPLRAGVGNIPETPGLGDQNAEITNSGEPLIGDGEADVPLIPGLPLAGMSTNRGTKAERVEVISWPGVNEGEGARGSYIAQVSGFNGAFGEETYAFRYTITPPASAPIGDPRPAQFHTGSSPAPAPLGATDHPQSIILTNPTRFNALYPGQAPIVDASLTALAGATQAIVFPVDSDLGVRNAYEAWDDQPSDPDRANDVVRAINAAVDNFVDAAHRPDIKSITIAGTDEVIPMARLADLTQTANEQTFAQELRTTAVGTGGNNALLGAALAGRILSDDPYGTYTPRAFSGNWMYIPDVALGRLVETPAQIQATVNEYLTPVGGDPAGTLRPTSTLTAGADFMTTLADSIEDSFAEQFGGATNRSLINNTWNRTQIVSEAAHGGTLDGAAPSIIAINTHYSASALAPAAKSDPGFPGAPHLSADNYAIEADAARRLLFTMGCHSGFNITDYLAGGTTQDWPSALAAEPVSAYVANTGFGIGVKHMNAFSQKLFAEFANQIGHTSFGGALQQAKQQYLADGITNVYDYKVNAEAMYFGIPQYTIAGATTPPPPTPAPAAGARSRQRQPAHRAAERGASHIGCRVDRSSDRRRFVLDHRRRFPSDRAASTGAAKGVP